MLGEHGGFILAAYGATVIAVAGCALAIVLDYRTQIRRLAALENQGLVRRSAVAKSSHDAGGPRPDWDV